MFLKRPKAARLGVFGEENLKQQKIRLQKSIIGCIIIGGLRLKHSVSRVVSSNFQELCLSNVLKLVVCLDARCTFS